MSRRDIYSFWHFDLSDQFVSHPEDEDGYVVFDTATRSVWACVYDTGDESPDTALSSDFVGIARGESHFPFRDDPLLQGRCDLNDSDSNEWAFVEELIQQNRRNAVHSPVDDSTGDESGAPSTGVKFVLLATYTAARGAMAKLGFYLESKSDIEWALESWRSIQYMPPHWIRLCISSDKSLSGMRKALETAIRIDEELSLLQQSGDLGAATPLIIAALQDERRIVRQSACYALGVIGDPKSTSELLAMTSDEETLVKIRAAEALYRLGVPFETVGPVFAAALASTREALFKPYGYPDRYIAALLLKNIGPVGAGFTKGALQNCLQDESGYVRVMAAQALLSQGAPTVTLLPGLIDAITNRRMPMRELVRVAETLFEFGQPVDQVLPVVIDAVEAREWAAYADAMHLLQRMRDSASSAISAVISAAVDDNPSIRLLAENTLLRIRPSE